MNQNSRYFIGKFKFKQQKSNYALTASEVLKRNLLPVNTQFPLLYGGMDPVASTNPSD